MDAPDPEPLDRLERALAAEKLTEARLARTPAGWRTTPRTRWVWEPRLLADLPEAERTRWAGLWKTVAGREEELR